MKCPNCENTELHLSNRSGVEIDYCPSCRGVWLDRGELDKVIERADRYDDERYRDRDRGGRDDDYDRRRDHDYPKQHYPAKKKSFWSELFD
jgi:uncharacterized protein